MDSCKGCGSSSFQAVFKMDPMPLAGGFTRTREEALATKKIPLTWLQCLSCELVQVQEDVPDELLYRNYCYASSSIGALREHFIDYSIFLTEKFGTSPINVLEIGCNDGVLLRRLPATWRCIGVDPSDVAADAEPGNYELVNEPFSSAMEFVDFDLVLASNCLAHITNIQDVVKAAANALKPDGQFWVEVHDLDSTLLQGQWDTIYHEHKVEYNLASLCRTVESYGLRLLEVTKLPLHGGLIRAGFVKANTSSFVARDSVHYTFDLLSEMYKNRRLTTLYHALIGKKLIAYGASGRATVWFNQFPELEFQAVIDDSPLRQGKFIPGVGWPIVPWSECPEGEAILITAWNYADAIQGKHPEYDGKWLQTWGG